MAGPVQAGPGRVREQCGTSQKRNVEHVGRSSGPPCPCGDRSGDVSAAGDVVDHRAAELEDLDGWGGRQDRVGGGDEVSILAAIDDTVTEPGDETTEMTQLLTEKCIPSHTAVISLSGWKSYVTPETCVR